LISNSKDLKDDKISERNPMQDFRNGDENKRGNLFTTLVKQL